MPAGLVEDHDRVLALTNRRSEVVEELLHRLGVGVGHDEGEAVIGGGIDASKDVGEREALVAEARWALAALPPDMAGPALLANPRRVLEEQADALAFMCIRNLSEVLRLFLKAACAAGTFFRVAGPRLSSRKPKLAQDAGHRGHVQTLGKPLLAIAHQILARECRKAARLRVGAGEHDANELGLLLGVELRRASVTRQVGEPIKACPL
jgi:hypothetical protein